MSNPYLPETPYQLTRDELDQLTPEQIEDARRKGHLHDLLTPKPNPFEDKPLEELLEIARSGTAAYYHDAQTTDQNTDEGTEEEGNDE